MLWHEYGKGAEPHKPPFDGKAHISGQNLFVSAYHGFATLGNEHTPAPMPFEKFPPYAIELMDGTRNAGRLVIPVKVTIAEGLDAGRYRLLAKLQLTKPGKGKHPGLLRNFLANAQCGSEEVKIIVPDYVGIWRLDLDEYQVHGLFVLLDAVTDYRSQEQPYSTIVKAI